MTVLLKNDWLSQLAGIKTGTHCPGNEFWRHFNKKFDELQRQRCLVETASQAPLNFLVFVLWKVVGPDEKRNGSVMDNIQRLNDLVVPDSYPLPLQSKIIANI